MENDMDGLRRRASTISRRMSRRISSGTIESVQSIKRRFSSIKSKNTGDAEILISFSELMSVLSDQMICAMLPENVKLTDLGESALQEDGVIIIPKGDDAPYVITTKDGDRVKGTIDIDKLIQLGEAGIKGINIQSKIKSIQELVEKIRVEALHSVEKIKTPYFSDLIFMSDSQYDNNDLSSYEDERLETYESFRSSLELSVKLESMCKVLNKRLDPSFESKDYFLSKMPALSPEGILTYHSEIFHSHDDLLSNLIKLVITSAKDLEDLHRLQDSSGTLTKDELMEKSVRDLKSDASADYLGDIICQSQLKYSFSGFSREIIGSLVKGYLNNLYVDKDKQSYHFDAMPSKILEDLFKQPLKVFSNMSVSEGKDFRNLNLENTLIEGDVVNTWGDVLAEKGLDVTDDLKSSKDIQGSETSAMSEVTLNEYGDLDGAREERKLTEVSFPELSKRESTGEAAKQGSVDMLTGFSSKLKTPLQRQGKSTVVHRGKGLRQS